MKALEQRMLFTGVTYDADKSLKRHKDRLKNTKKQIDNNLPFGMEGRSRSPNRRFLAKRAEKEHIYRENFLLAKRIFDIMEGESDLVQTINHNNKHNDNHPGTMNFRGRLEEAQRIHRTNMLLAERLNTIQPFYKSEDLQVVRPVKVKSPKSSKKTKKSKFMAEFEYSLQLPIRGDTAGYFHGFKFNGEESYYDQTQSARPPGEDDDGEFGKRRPRSILLEYTKVQDNRVLDIAVVKEPFRDRYAIFGKDIDDGQRFELRLSSEEVSNILDGDILVTSVDNVEVWLALLNKVKLQQVEVFTKMPFTHEEVNYLSRNGGNIAGLNQQQPPANNNTLDRAPSAPEASLRPSQSDHRSRGRILVDPSSTEEDVVPQQSSPYDSPRQLPSAHLEELRQQITDQEIAKITEIIAQKQHQKQSEEELHGRKAKDVDIMEDSARPKSKQHSDLPASTNAAEVLIPTSRPSTRPTGSRLSEKPTSAQPANLVPEVTKPPAAKPPPATAKVEATKPAAPAVVSPRPTETKPAAANNTKTVAPTPAAPKEKVAPKPVEAAPKASPRKVNTKPAAESVSVPIASNNTSSTSKAQPQPPVASKPVAPKESKPAVAPAAKPEPAPKPTAPTAHVATKPEGPKQPAPPANKAGPARPNASFKKKSVDASTRSSTDSKNGAIITAIAEAVKTATKVPVAEKDTKKKPLPTNVTKEMQQMAQAVVSQALSNALERIQLATISKAEVTGLEQGSVLSTTTVDNVVEKKPSLAEGSVMSIKSTGGGSVKQASVELKQPSVAMSSSKDAIDDNASAKSERFNPVEAKTSEVLVVSNKKDEEDVDYQDDYEMASVKIEDSVATAQKVDFNLSVASGSVVEGSEYANASFEMETSQ